MPAMADFNSPFRMSKKYGPPSRWSDVANSRRFDVKPL
jgi:hypothetical protein